MPIRSIFFIALCTLLSVTNSAYGQAEARAQACFFEQNFENGLPGDWDFGNMVEQQTDNGVGLGEFVPAWNVGSTAQLNGSSYFPVPNLPNGNSFLMANDDIAPCNCDMNDVIATTPVIDLSARSQVSFSCRTFNEMNLGAGYAIIQATPNGVDWDTLLTIPAIEDEWQNIWLDLSTYDGTTNFQLRFRWSDGGGWASGFALDDVCLREAFVHDLTVVKAYTHDISIGPFVNGDQSLRYGQIPLEQVAPMIVSAEVLNTGTTTEAVIATVTIWQNGAEVFSVSPQPIGDLDPGERLIASIETGWVPTSTGDVEVRIDVQPVETDVDLSDNLGTASLRITGQGWDNGYSVMAADEDNITGEVGNSEQFVATVRMEVANSGGTISGISISLSASSAIGEEIRAILMDGNLAFLDTSFRHVITQEDLNTAAAYGLLYLPLSDPMERGSGDYFAGIQHLTTDSSEYVGVYTSGTRPLGANAVLQGATFEVNYIMETPIVRIHFAEYPVGVNEIDPSEDNALHIYPVPMSDHGTIQVDFTGPADLLVLDASGRLVEKRNLGYLGISKERIDLDVSTLSTGIYTVIVRGERSQATGKVIVSR
ncbi:MAG: T9SS type A sorting domain-containing protein [Flavobacteriales bacterium]